MSQVVGHLDFFPNGGKEMPGCKKNALSQIVDIDGIWEGKPIYYVHKESSLGQNLCFLLVNMLRIFGTGVTFSISKDFSLYPRDTHFHQGKWT